MTAKIIVASICDPPQDFSNFGLMTRAHLWNTAHKACQEGQYTQFDKHLTKVIVFHVNCSYLLDNKNICILDMV